MWGEAPANDKATKFGTGVDVQDVSHTENFKVKIYGVQILRGVEFWLSPLTLHMGLKGTLRRRIAYIFFGPS